MSKKRLIFFVILLLLAVFLAVAGVFLFTPAGGRFVVRRVMQGVSSPDGYDVKAITGSFSSHLALREAELRDAAFLPDGYAVRVQKAEIYFDSLSLAGLNVELYNGRLLLPGGAAVVADGMYQEGALDAQVYFREAQVRDLLGLFAQDKRTASLRGTVASLDAQLQGPLSAFRVEGSAVTGKIEIERIAAEDVRLRYDLRVFPSSSQPLDGSIVIDSGRLLLPRAAVRLTQGRVTFERDKPEPALDIKGEAVVDRIPIGVRLTGTPSAPDLRFTSDDASLSQMQLMAMLLTGRSLSRDQEALARGQVPADLAKDVLDYLVFGGKITEFITRLGLKEVSLTVEGNKQGVGVTKEVAKDLQVRYGVEQKQGRMDGEHTTTQTAGVSYDVTRSVSVEATTAASRISAGGNETAAPEADNAVLLKYKKNF